MKLKLLDCVIIVHTERTLIATDIGQLTGRDRVDPDISEGCFFLLLVSAKAINNEICSHRREML